MSSCKYYGHCRHRCCECGKLESTGVTVSGGVLQITVIPLQAFRDYKYYKLDMCVVRPAVTGTEPVTISDGTNTYPLFDTNCQPVVSGKLRGHKQYLIRFGAGGAYSGGTMPSHFTVCRGLECMEYSSTAALQQG